jgi:hypothetical protein
MQHTATAALRLPAARGDLSAWVTDRLTGVGARRAPSAAGADAFGDDLQLALYLACESHFRDLPGVTADREWDPQLMSFRASLEHRFEAALRDRVGAAPTGPVERVIPAMIDADDGPSVSRFMETDGTIDQMRDFVVHRSAYQLKEGDAHTFAVPRLHGRAKQLLVAIQAGEYGADAPDRVMHCELFGQTMRELGLDDRPNAYLDVLPASALMVSNTISMFGLNRRWRGALVGHLSVFEMTSVTPMGRYSKGLERMGASAAARRFYDVHILADAEHELMALEMAQALAESEPNLCADIVFGAQCVLVVERLFAERLFGGWTGAAPRVRVAA